MDEIDPVAVFQPPPRYVPPSPPSQPAQERKHVTIPHITISPPAADDQAPAKAAPATEGLPDVESPPQVVARVPGMSAEQEDAANLADKLLAGGMSPEKVQAMLAERGLRLAAPDEQPPSMFDGATDPAQYRLNDALHVLPPHLDHDDRAAIAQSAGEAFQAMGIPPFLGKGILQSALETYQRISALDEAGQKAHAADVKRQIEGMHRDFFADLADVQEALGRVKAIDADLHHFVAELLIDPLFFVTVADSVKRGRK